MHRYRAPCIFLLHNRTGTVAVSTVSETSINLKSDAPSPLSPVYAVSPILAQLSYLVSVSWASEGESYVHSTGLLKPVSMHSSPGDSSIPSSIGVALTLSFADS